MKKLMLVVMLYISVTMIGMSVDSPYVYKAVAYAADFCVTIPDPIVPDMADAFATRFGYLDTIQNPAWDDDGQGTDPDAQGDPREIANPQTKAAFARKILRDRVFFPLYTEYMAGQAGEAAAAAARAQAEADAAGMN